MTLKNLSILPRILAGLLSGQLLGGEHPEKLALNCCNLPEGAYYEYITSQSQKFDWPLKNIHEGGPKDDFIGIPKNKCAMKGEVEIAVKTDTDGKQIVGIYFKIDKYESDSHGIPIDNTYFSTGSPMSESPKFFPIKEYPTNMIIIISSTDDLGKPLHLTSTLKPVVEETLSFRKSAENDSKGPVLAWYCNGEQNSPGTAGVELRPIVVQVIPRGSSIGKK